MRRQQRRRSGSKNRQRTRSGAGGALLRRRKGPSSAPKCAEDETSGGSIRGARMPGMTCLSSLSTRVCARKTIIDFDEMRDKRNPERRFATNATWCDAWQRPPSAAGPPPPPLERRFKAFNPPRSGGQPSHQQGGRRGRETTRARAAKAKAEAADAKAAAAAAAAGSSDASDGPQFLPYWDLRDNTLSLFGSLQVQGRLLGRVGKNVSIIGQTGRRVSCFGLLPPTDDAVGLGLRPPRGSSLPVSRAAPRSARRGGSARLCLLVLPFITLARSAAAL